MTNTNTITSTTIMTATHNGTVTSK